LILEEIEAKLQEIDENVFYGMVDDKMREMAWNYIVFNRTGVKYSANKTAASDSFDVHIIRENFVPDGVESEVVQKLCSLSGMRVSGDAVFNYMMKPNTNTVVEALTLSFVRARKA
jgi:hypothetical protein